MSRGPSQKRPFKGVPNPPPPRQEDYSHPRQFIPTKISARNKSPQTPRPVSSGGTMDACSSDTHASPPPNRASIPRGTRSPKPAARNSSRTSSPESKTTDPDWPPRSTTPGAVTLSPSGISTAWAAPSPPHPDRPGPGSARRRLQESLGEPRHHHRRRPPYLPPLRGAGRVRARPDPGEDRGGAGGGAGTGSWRAALRAGAVRAPALTAASL